MSKFIIFLVIIALIGLFYFILTHAIILVSIKTLIHFAIASFCLGLIIGFIAKAIASKK